VSDDVGVDQEGSQLGKYMSCMTFPGSDVPRQPNVQHNDDDNTTNRRVDRKFYDGISCRFKQLGARGEHVRVLITGGAGFIGFHTASMLLSERHDVALLDNFNDFYNPGLKRRNVQDLKSVAPFVLYEADILDRERLRDAFTDFRPDAIVHLAAWAGVRPSLEKPELYARVNVTGTVNVLDCAKEFAVQRVVFASSSSVYGGNDRVPFSEKDAVDHPISPYAATKRAGELLCYTYSHNWSMNISCLRFFTVYGPRQRPEMAIHRFAECICSGRPIPVYGQGRSQRDYTYIDDIVSGIRAALEANPRYAVLNLGESRTIALLDLISELENALGHKAEVRFLPEQPGDMFITYADISEARRMLGYTPRVPIEEGIRRFATWYLRNRGIND
jgi:UDP-glucuronate 4-epimerase